MKRFRVDFNNVEILPREVVGETSTYIFFNAGGIRRREYKEGDGYRYAECPASARTMLITELRRRVMLKRRELDVLEDKLRDAKTIQEFML